MIDIAILRFSFSLCKQFFGSRMLRSLSICEIYENKWSAFEWTTRVGLFKFRNTFLRRKFTRRVFFSANIATMTLLSIAAPTIFMSNQNTHRSVTDFILKVIKWRKQIFGFSTKWMANIFILPYGMPWMKIVVKSNIWWNTEYDHQYKAIKAQYIA